MHKIAVVILNYNGRKYLEKFLPIVIEKSGDVHIVVVDNNSEDDSVEYLKSHFSNVQLLKLTENHGYAGGYNKALKKIESKYYVLLNSDVEVTDRWLNPMLAFLEDKPEYAACQPKIKDYNYRNRFEYAGACGGYLDSLGYPYCRGRIFDSTEIDNGQYDIQKDIFWASGACMMIRSIDFHSIGRFDKSYFAHMEEIDLCWRLQSKKRKIRSIPESVVFHVGGGTLSYQSSFKTYLNFRNGLTTLIKNLPLMIALYKIPIRILLDWLAAFVFLFKGGSKHSRAVIKAHYMVIKKLINILKMRQITSNTQESKIIILHYFLLGRKKINQ